MTLFRTPALSLFETDLFRDSALVGEACSTLGEVFATEDLSRRGHFTTFFRVITLRRGPRFPSPVLNDLYTLHELWHLRHAYAGPAEGGAEPGWLDWVRRRVASEFQASLMSECLIYFHLPGLRELTFPHEIWVDRFLHLRGRPLFAIEQTLAEERRRALNAPRHDDFIEFQIHGYAAQNMQWCRIWAEPVGYGPDTEIPAFRAVERRVSQPGWEGGHAEWIAAQSDGGVPFARQADAFERVYDATMAQWGNQYLRR